MLTRGSLWMPARLAAVVALVPASIWCALQLSAPRMVVP